MFVYFKKYQGAGNDFVMIDNFSGQYDDLSVSQIQSLCDRRFGIGADGLIKINKSAAADFYVDYYNSDGSQSFCGNGARCSVRFVNEEILKEKSQYSFDAIDGLHEGEVLSYAEIRIQMTNVERIEIIKDNHYLLDTGSPHYIVFTENIDELDLKKEGQKIRYSDRFNEKGVNVNFIELLKEGELRIRTYERGVEDETLACGTGITAAALAHLHLTNKEGMVKVHARGGELSVKAFRNSQGFGDVELIGPATFVFDGKMECA